MEASRRYIIALKGCAIVFGRADLAASLVLLTGSQPAPRRSIVCGEYAAQHRAADTDLYTHNLALFGHQQIVPPALLDDLYLDLGGVGFGDAKKISRANNCLANFPANQSKQLETEAKGENCSKCKLPKIPKQPKNVPCDEQNSDANE